MRRLIVLAAIVAAGAWLALAWLESGFDAPGPAAIATRVKVPAGTSVRGVLERLEQAGVLAEADRTALYLRVHRLQPSVKAGEYEIPAHASPRQIVELLQSGRVILEQLTIVEGATFRDFRRALEQHPGVTVTLRGRSDAQVMAALGTPGEHPEGRFFPDTYRFAAGTSDAEILRLARAQMDRLLADAWRQRAADLPFDTPYQALVLASVVEKETGLAAERPRIAGVFVLRLRKGMRLQSDPTVIYGLGERYDGDIRNRDLVTDTPYNTYTRAGLPPTPIALPGRESVMAAVRPDVTGDLFFVATGSGQGDHVFSKTLPEHEAAVRRYLQRLRAGQGGRR